MRHRQNERSPHHETSTHQTFVAIHCASLVTLVCMATVVLSLLPASANAQQAITIATQEPEGDSVDLVLLEEQAVKSAVAYVSPSVVRIETLGGTGSNNSISSAICISETGLFLTSAYNLRGDPSSVFIKAAPRQQQDATDQVIETRRFIATIVATDHSRNLVLLKTEPDDSFPFYPVQIAQQTGLKVGQTVIAVGKVYDERQANLSVGIISAFGRIWSRAIQTDAKVSRANYGGPLINLAGEAIGILCPLTPDDDAVEAGAPWYDSGIGFAVPLSDYQTNIDRLAKGEDLHRGLMGVSMLGKDMYADKPVIGRCQPKSPATEAGLKPGDLLKSINGIAVSSQAQMKHVLGPLVAGEVVELKVRREDQTLDLSAILAEKIEPYVELAIGVIPKSTAADGQLKVAHVIRDSPAAVARIEIDDVIDEVDGTKLTSWDELETKLIEFEAGDTVELNLNGEEEKTKTVSLELAAVNAQPPIGLADAVEIDEETAQCAVLDITSAESSNACYAIVPKNDFKEIGSPSLFVWVSEPGVSDSAETLKAVAGQCQRHNMVLLVPQSLDTKTWTPGETDFIVKAIQRLKKQVAFDAERVAIGGEKTAGTMACLTAFTNRDLFQGLVMFDALFPRRLPRVETAPEQRMLIYSAASTDFKSVDKLDLIDKALIKKKFPLYRNKDSVKRLIELLPEVAGWVSTLNRR